MKANRILIAAICALGALGMSSCLGMTDAVGTGYYPGYDDVWYNGYGYGLPYYGGYYGPSYGYGPALPPPPPPGGRPPQQQAPPSNSGASRPHSPTVTTTPTGTQRPGNNGLPTSRPTVQPRRSTQVSTGTTTQQSGATTPMNRGRR